MLLRVKPQGSERTLTRLPIGWLAALFVAVVVSILFIDRPLALFCTHLQAARRLFQLCAAPSLLALPLSGIVCVIAIARRFAGQPPLRRLWLMMSVATIAGTAAKDELKWLFGRPWPHTWLATHLYAWQPFTDNLGYGAFPSGHTSYIAAPLCVLWAVEPRARAAVGIIIGLVMAGLVLANYHFLGDVLGGLIVGILSAWATLALMRPSPAEARLFE